MNTSTIAISIVLFLISLGIFARSETLPELELKMREYTNTSINYSMEKIEKRLDKIDNKLDRLIR